MTIFLILAAILNIILNILFIPIWGITGAAIATMITYFLYFIASKSIANKYLRISIPYKEIIKYILFSIVMSIIIKVIPVRIGSAGNLLLLMNLLIRMLVGFFTYFVLIVLLDKDGRSLLCRMKASLLEKVSTTKSDE